MEFPYLSFFIALNLALVATHAALPPQMYWKSKLPTTQMPKAIIDLLHPDIGNGKENSDLVQDAATTETQLDYNPNVTLFFFENDLNHGTKMYLEFVKTSDDEAAFLPREVANSIPFSSNKVENILNHLSIKQGSDDSEIVKTTIGMCEEPDIKGEEKRCVTSLESMIDYTTSKLGNYVEAVSTELEKESDAQQYTIAKGVKKLGKGKRTIVCHKTIYPYAVFYCHKSYTTKIYSVPLEGVDGSRVKAIAVCHTDTSQWNPKHMAFKVLKVQRGTVPVCHFLQQDHVAWVTKNSKFNSGNLMSYFTQVDDDDLRVYK